MFCYFLDLTHMYFFIMQIKSSRPNQLNQYQQFKEEDLKHTTEENVFFSWYLQFIHSTSLFNCRVSKLYIIEMVIYTLIPDY